MIDRVGQKPMGSHLRAQRDRQCGRSVRWISENLILKCERAKKHQGCHFDITNEVWFDKHQGKWVIMPRRAA